jgi:MerR family transcriptional regulator, redox-sensitive transcriptional activator SoxR
LLLSVASALLWQFKLALSQVPDSELLIGEVARRAGLRPSAIRYYESIGLLPEPDRTAGRRRYSPETLRTLSVIAAGQRAGLSLSEVGELLAASNGDGAVSERLRAIAHRKLPEVKSLIEHAELVRRWLEAAADCRCPTLEDCPLFDEAIEVTRS